ncbi:ATP-binding protein [Robiginitalea sp. IMCC44478]|uniref:ATP-binding protein n=1 Tax=Robiginitalea sp. IMCC44478 TaxID=3459122 RepID=UPI00404290EA
MRKILVLLALLPLSLMGQDRIYSALDSIEFSGRSLWLGNDWRFQKGDNPDWAQPEFDDSSWKSFTETSDLVKLDSVETLGINEIVWYRKYIKLGRNLNDILLLRVFQTGAMEIFLDGKLLYSFGTINPDPKKAEAYNPWFKEMFPLKLSPYGEHTLAVRFMNLKPPGPVLASPLYPQALLRISPFSHINPKEFKLNYGDAQNEYWTNAMYVVSGIAIFMFVLFLLYFLFFPTERLNGYFALCGLVFCFFMVANIMTLESIGSGYYSNLAVQILAILYLLLALFCIYRIFERPLGRFFWGLTLLGGGCIMGIILFGLDVLLPIFGGLAIFETIRISILSIKTHRVGALIFLASGVLHIIFFAIIFIDILDILEEQDFRNYYPLGFVVLPMCIAIYLGYAFGKRSQELRLNLEQVRKLSEEKEAILEEQKRTLEEQVRERTESLNTSLRNLKETQSQLIHSEKMASLGELTAGIAHEIKNPLNFVNNFSEVSQELIDEMKAEIAARDFKEVEAIAEDLKQNLEKINHHGQRADSIVKGMLQHSRSGDGKKEPTNLNALADEYLRLAYHGLRAKDKSFNATLETDFDPDVKKVNVVPQEIGRVLLNLFTNAFHAVSEKKREAPEDYEPTVAVRTRKTAKGVEIRVEDNGKGIPPGVQGKIFQPFFTTKKTGEGTGLGLSMSYDIVTKGHNGQLKVESTQGRGAVFFVILPTDTPDQ